MAEYERKQLAEYERETKQLAEFKQQRHQFLCMYVYVCVETEDMKKYDLLTHNTQ